MTKTPTRKLTAPAGEAVHAHPGVRYGQSAFFSDRAKFPFKCDPASFGPKLVGTELERWLERVRLSQPK